MQTILIVLGILAVNALVWIPLVLWGRRKSAEARQSLEDRVAGTRERLVVEPEGGTYCRAALGKLGAVRVYAVFALTDRHVLIHPVIGGPVEIARTEIAEVRASKWFQGSYRAGQTYVVLKLSDGREVALATRDPEQWLEALRRRGWDAVG